MKRTPEAAAAAAPAHDLPVATEAVEQRLLDVWRHEIVERWLAPLDAHFLGQTCRALRRAFLLSGVWDLLPPRADWIDASGPARALWLWRTLGYPPRARLVTALIEVDAPVVEVVAASHLPFADHPVVPNALVFSWRPDLIQRAVHDVFAGRLSTARSIFESNKVRAHAVVAALAAVCDVHAAAASLGALMSALVFGAHASFGSFIDPVALAQRVWFHAALGAGHVDVACTLVPLLVADTHLALWTDGFTRLLDRDTDGAGDAVQHRAVARVFQEWRRSAAASALTYPSYETIDAASRLLCAAARYRDGRLLAETAVALGVWLNSRGAPLAAALLGSAVELAAAARAPDAMRRLLDRVRDEWRAVGLVCAPLSLERFARYDDDADAPTMVCLDDACRALLCTAMACGERTLFTLESVLIDDRADLLARLADAGEPALVPTADGCLPLCAQFFDFLMLDGDDLGADEWHRGARCFDFLLTRFPRETHAAWGAAGLRPVLDRVFTDGHFEVLDVLVRRGLVALAPLAAEVAAAAARCGRLDWLARAHAAHGGAALASALCAETHPVADQPAWLVGRHYLHAHGCLCDCGVAYRARAARFAAPGNQDLY